MAAHIDPNVIDSELSSDKPFNNLKVCASDIHSNLRINQITKADYNLFYNERPDYKVDKLRIDMTVYNFPGCPSLNAIKHKLCNEYFKNGRPTELYIFLINLLHIINNIFMTFNYYIRDISSDTEETKRHKKYLKEQYRRLEVYLLLYKGAITIHEKYLKIISSKIVSTSEKFKKYVQDKYSDAEIDELFNEFKELGVKLKEILIDLESEYPTLYSKLFKLIEMYEKTLRYIDDRMFFVTIKLLYIKPTEEFDGKPLAYPNCFILNDDGETLFEINGNYLIFDKEYQFDKNSSLIVKTDNSEYNISNLKEIPEFEKKFQIKINPLTLEILKAELHNDRNDRKTLNSSEIYDIFKLMDLPVLKIFHNGCNNFDTRSDNQSYSLWNEFISIYKYQEESDSAKINLNFPILEMSGNPSDGGGSTRKKRSIYTHKRKINKNCKRKYTRK